LTYNTIAGNLKEAIEKVEELAEARKINYLVIATKKDIDNQGSRVQ